MKMSHQAAYALELEKVETIETEHGFVAFRFHENGKECFIRDIFIAKEFRSGGGQTLAWKLADQVVSLAKERGCTHVTGVICPSMAGASYNMAAHLKYGFQIHSAEADKIWMIKEI